MKLLVEGPRKGTVRGLDNALGRGVFPGGGPPLTPADLPPDLAPQTDDPHLVDDLGEAVGRFEKQPIQRVLRREPANKDAPGFLRAGLGFVFRRAAPLRNSAAERHVPRKNSRPPPP